MRRSMRAIAALLSLCAASVGWAQEERPYTEGAVVITTFIRTRYGMFDEYMKFIAGPYKRAVEEEKRAGVIVDYGVYQAYPHTPTEPDVILTVVFKNWAAFDGLRDKTDAIEAKIFGTLDASNKAAVDREKIREVLGSQTLQRLVLK